MIQILNTIEVVLTGLLLGIFLVAYSHYRKASYKLEFVMVALASVTLVAAVKLLIWGAGFLIGVAA